MIIKINPLFPIPSHADKATDALHRRKIVCRIKSVAIGIVDINVFVKRIKWS